MAAQGICCDIYIYIYIYIYYCSLTVSSKLELGLELNSLVA